MPKQFDAGIRDDICKEMEKGKSLRKVCEMKSMPSISTVMKWVSQDEVFSEQYTRAREARADAIFEDCLDIADDAKADDVAKARLMVDTRKWMLGKMAPKKYGDKVSHEVSGPSGGAIQTITTTMTPKEAAEQYAKTREGR